MLHNLTMNNSISDNYKFYFKNINNFSNRDNFKLSLRKKINSNNLFNLLKLKDKQLVFNNYSNNNNNSTRKNIELFNEDKTHEYISYEDNILNNTKLDNIDLRIKNLSFELDFVSKYIRVYLLL